MDIYALTHRGKVREQNEDSIYLSQGGYPYLAIVADGMGGHVAGQVASSRAVAFVRKRLEGYDLDTITKEQFKRLVEEASDYILELASKEEAYKDMGTTFTAAIIRENSAILAHIGDSRAYTFSGGALKQVSHDHSYVQFLVDKGYLSEEEAEQSPYRNIITRAVGMEEAEAEAYEVSFEQGESLLLCSDGLTAHLSNYEIGLCLQEEYGSERKAKELLEVALLRGGRDNISIIIANNNEDKMIEGRFELLSTVDEGGTSIVYQAKDQKTGGLVALKMLREELADQPEYVENFQREAEMLSCLQHKNIQHLVYRGIHQGRRYIATEFIDGESLKRHIEEGTLSLEQNVSVAVQICEALAYLHGKGILHKDLKPLNVLLTAPSRPILLDFGIAQRQEEQGADAAEIENAEVFGTVNYFSPEQAKGEALDSRTDIYSMGVLLYEMLTGQLPFQGEDNLSVALMHLHQPPVPPKEIDDQIPESLNRIVLKALSKEKEQRYRSIREMQADLQRALRRPDGKYVRIKAAKAPEKKTAAQKRAGRHAVLTAACVSAACLAVIGGFFAIFSAIGGTGGNRELYMPGFSDKTYEEAKQTLDELHLVPTFTYESSLEVEKGYIIRQMPEIGAVVQQGEEVFIVVSLGRDKVTPMPEVLGMQEEQALALLDAQGIRNVSVSYVDLPDQQMGVVVAQSPDGEAPVAEGQEVSITVNRPGEQNRAVPMLVGSKMEQAIDAAAEAGFGRVLIYAVNDGQSVGEVIFQSPQAEAQNVSFNTICMTVHQPKNGAVFQGTLKSDTAGLDRAGLVTATLSFSLDGRDYEFVVFEETFAEEQLFAQKYPGGVEYSLVLANQFRGQNCHLNVYLNGVVVYTSDS